MMRFDNSNNTTLQNKLKKIQTWQDLFRFSIDIAKSETHCGTLAYYKETVQEYDTTKGYGIASFKPFPLFTDQEEYILNAYFLKEDTEFMKGKVYCIMFMDYNFSNSLKAGKPIKTQDEETHSLTFGVVIETL